MDRDSLKMFSWIALVGFLLSLLVHTSTFFSINLESRFPAIWLLHLGVFIAFIPTIILQKSREKSGMDSYDAFFGMFRYAATWMKTLCIILIIYTAANFISSLILLEGGAPDVRDGKYILHSHGKIIRALTAEEYNRYKSYEVRLGSGHWMFFYFISYTALYSCSKELERKNN